MGMAHQHRTLLTTYQASARLALLSGLSAHDIELSLRSIGYLDVIPGLRLTLDMAATLRSRFIALQRIFPNLETTISHFVLAADLSLLAAQLNLNEGESILARHQNDNLDGLVDDPFRKLEGYPLSDLRKDLLALGWLYESLLASDHIHFRFPGRDTRQTVAKYPSKHLNLAQEGFEHAGFQQWADAVSRHAIETDKFLFREFASFNTLSEKFSSIQLTPKSIPQCLPARPPVVQFEHRKLSKNHRNALRPSEQKALQEYIKKQPSYYEALVIGVGLATGRTIRDTLNLPLLGHEAALAAPTEQHVKMESLTGYNGPYYRAIWVIPINEKNVIKLPLPEQISDLFCGLIKPDTNTRLINRLPLTHQNWETRCTAELMKTLDTGRLRANLILRDSLSRACYEKSANPSLSYWFAQGRHTAEQPVSTSQIALTYYLDPHGERTAKTYQAACQTLFGKYGSFENSLPTPNGNFGVTIEAHRESAEFMKQRIHAMAKSKDLIGLHNTFTQYSLLLLIVATAHRKSTTPFFFSWDIFLDELLAFISDKCIVGSEARVSPLAQVATDQAKAYFRHLEKLYQKLGDEHTIIKAHIASLIEIPRNSNRPACSDTNNVGLFFEIRPDGSTHTISTWDLSQLLLAAGIKVGIGDFRKALADALWGKQLSGMEIAALLGHANDLHPFGPASSWSVMQWADKIRPLIEEYLAERDWTLIESPLVHGNTRTPPPNIRIPSPIPGNNSYEGRRKEHLNAEERASRAIRTVLTDDFLEDQNYALDDDVIQSVREEIDELLGTDVDAKKCATAMLAQALQKLRRRGYAMNSFLPNRYRFQPSPIKLTFGRNLAIAKTFRQKWLARVGMPIGENFDKLERIAQLTISLVVLDGVLDSKRLVGIINALLKGNGIAKYPDAMTIRCKIETHVHEYDWSTITSDITSALALGLNATPAMFDSKLDLKKVSKRIEVICTKLLGRELADRAPWTFERLTSTFEPWWFLRQTGAMYSIASGLHNGPAAHVLSEISLLAKSEPTPTPAPDIKPLDLAPEIAISSAEEAAWVEIRKLLSASAGKLEEGTANSRAQRKSLTKILKQGIPEDLAYWRQDQQVVDLLLTFAQSLLESGGLRKSKLVFGSIKTYLESISKPLVRHGWDTDFSAMTIADYRDLYKAIEADCENKKTDWRQVLRMFHLHLRNTIGAPFLPEMEFNKSRMSKRCRGSLITVTALDTADDLLATSKGLSADQRKAARTLMYASIGYGGRQAECAGLAATDFDALDEKHLSIQANVIRDLKNRRRGRIVHRALLRPNQSRVISSQRKIALLSPSPEKYLFGTPLRSQKITTISPLIGAIKTATRSASCNDATVFHDLRHTFASKLLLAGLFLKSGHPALIQMAERLLGQAIIDQDFARQITGTPTDNPFFVDDAAQVLGHANIDTLLNVYCHIAPILLADTAFAVNKDIHVDDARLANMLGKERTALVKLRSRRERNQEATDSDSLIRHYLGKASNISITAIDSKNKENSRRQPTKGEDAFSPVLLDRLLCNRKISGQSLTDALGLAQQWELPTELVENVLQRYRELACETGFDDFEPDQSELVSAPPIRREGVLRGRQEREAALHRIGELFKRKERFCECFSAIAHAWRSTVDGRKPMIVCRNIQDLKQTLLVLKTLGAKDDQLVFEAFGNLQSPLLVEIQKDYSLSAYSLHGRFSRGPKNVKVEEIGISISQSAGSKIPDGRDFHRLMAIAWCALFALSDG